MATRTFSLHGGAYSQSGDVSIVVDFNGTEVFNGTVTTTLTEVPEPSTTVTMLATWTEDEMWWPSTAIPCSITVSGGTFFLAALGATKSHALPAKAANNHKIVAGASDSPVKQNVILDGILQDAQETEDGWHYIIEDGGVLTLDWYLPTANPGTPTNP